MRRIYSVYVTECVYYWVDVVVIIVLDKQFTEPTQRLVRGNHCL